MHRYHHNSYFFLVMYKTIIVEDEHHLQKGLSIMLQSVAPDTVEVTGYAGEVRNAVSMIDDQKPDLIFMDVMLNGGSGFDVLEKIQHKDFHLIFTTAYESHAIRAFKFNAIDYLLKPVDITELKLAINRVSERESFMQDIQLKQLAESTGKIQNTIIIPTQEAMHVVKIENIIRCESSGSYTLFFLADQKKIMVSKSLKYYEELLSTPVFFRVHQSHLININYIASYSKEGMVHMADNTHIPVSRSNKEKFFAFMKNGW